MATHSILSLASGGGGLDAGVHLALGGRSRTVCYVENEATAAAALVAGMEAQLLDDAPVWSDLRTFDGAAWRGLVDGVIGGYPCQPFSVAGRRRGADDPRHLWPYIADIVRAVEPRWCFFENVGGHLRLGFREVAEELRGMGYRVAATLWRAEEVGAPHRRERLFILAVDDTDQGRRGWRSDAAIGSAEAGWRGPFTEGGRSAVAHADEQGRGVERGAGLQLAGASLGYDAHGRDEAVAYAERSRWPEAGLGRDIDAGREPQARSGAVGDTDALGRRAQGDDCFTSEQLDLATGGLGWPPGPTGDWSGVPQQLWPSTPQPAVRGVVDGAVLASTPESAAAMVRRVEECVCECHREAGVESKGAPGIPRGNSVREVWVDGARTAASRRPQQASRDSNALLGLPYGVASPAFCRTCELPSVRTGVPADTFSALAHLLGFLPRGDGAAVSGETVGGQATHQGVRRLRRDIRFQEATREDLQSALRERFGLAQPLSRTDWLRILGNGVVPEQAAAAFRELWNELGKDTPWGK